MRVEIGGIRVTMRAVRLLTKAYRMNRYQPKFLHVADFVRQQGIRSVLDLGCRDCVLRDVLADDSLDYAGADLFQNAAGTVNYVCDITQGVPVADSAYELVTALDVLEHLDDFQGGIDEMFRIARRYMIVALPNMAHFQFRFRLLFKGRLNSKYDLKYGYGLDRHRWVTVLDQTDRYFAAYCAEKGCRLRSIHTSLGSPRLTMAENTLKFLRFPPVWHVRTVLYIIEKPQS